MKLTFNDLPVGATFALSCNTGTHTYRKLPDAVQTSRRGTKDGQAGRAELISRDPALVGLEHFRPGLTVVVNRNRKVIETQ